MLIHACQTKQKGFSMIEIAMVLIVLGAMLTVVLRPLVSSMKQERELDGRKSVEALKNGVIGYVMVNGDLPEADELDQVAGRFDPWGSEMAYFVAVAEDDDPCGFDSGAVGAIEYTVDDGGDVEHVAFLVASPGPDRKWGQDQESTPDNMYDPDALGSDPVELQNKRDDIVDYVTVLELMGVACP